MKKEVKEVKKMMFGIQDSLLRQAWTIMQKCSETIL